MKEMCRVVLVILVYSLATSISSYAAQSAGAVEGSPTICDRRTAKELTIADLQELYRPTKERCRPSIQAGRETPFVVASPINNLSELSGCSGVDGDFICMLTGHKDVVLDDDNGYKKLPQSVKKLFEKEDIASIECEKGSIFYRPTREAKMHAFLLRKVIDMPQPLPFRQYLRGHFLGYSDEDIKAFYIHSIHVDLEKWKKGLKERRIYGREELLSKTIDPKKIKKAVEDFERDKRAAIKWIEENRLNIEHAQQSKR